MSTSPLRRAALAFSFFGLASFACSCSDDSTSSPPDPSCTASNRCTFIAAGTSEILIQDQLNSLKAGDTIKFGEGTFELRNQIVLPSNVNGITVLGSGRDKTVLDFHLQTVAANDGIYAQYVQNLRFEGFTVKDSPGNAIKVLQGTNVIFRDLKTYWTSEDGKTHGAYGLYPVQSTNVLVENSLAIGASDTGIYVGQSKNIVVRNNEAHHNVAGIEIENCFNADVHDNDAHDNASGILVFDLPHLEQTGGRDVRIFKNKIRNNNTTNFSPSGLLQNVPAGTGFFVLANTNVEVFQNTFEGNDTAQTSIISYLILPPSGEPDPNYKQPWPSKINVHDNTYSGGGSKPDALKDLGAVLLLGDFPGGRVPDVLYDGILPKDAPGDNPQQICLKNNQHASADSAFSNLHFDQFDQAKLNLAEVREMNPPGFDCSLPPVAPVTLPAGM